MGIDVCFFPIFHSSSLLPTALPSPFKYVEEAEYLVRILGFFLLKYRRSHPTENNYGRVPYMTKFSLKKC